MEPPPQQPFPPPDPRLGDPFAPPDGVPYGGPYGSPYGAPVAAPPPVSRAVVGLAAAIALVAGAGVVAALTRGGDGAPAVSPAAAGCGPVRDVPLPLDASHSTGRVDYDGVPHGGPHSPSPLPGFLRYVPRDGVPPDVAERAVHNLEHGYVVVWYDAGATDERLDLLRDALRESPQKVLAVPWRDDVGDGRDFALAAWGHVQTCDLPTAEAIRAFYGEHGGPNGDAPEANAP